MSRFEFTMDVRMLSGSDAADVYIGGTICPNAYEEWDEVSAAQLAKKLSAAADARRLNVHINSGGGSVAQAVAMRAMLISHAASEKHVYIDGVAASAATLPACIGAPVHMAAGSMYMIHNPIMNTSGDHRQLRHDADVLEKYADMFAGVYAQQSDGELSDIRAMMDAETWMTADEAVEHGFASDVMQVEAAACMTREEISGVYARGAEYKMEEGKPEMEWKDITLEALEDNRADIAQALLQRGAENERARIRAIDEAAGLSDPTADEAKYVKIMSAGEYALAALKDMWEHAPKNPGANYMAQRAKETAPMANVAPEPQSAAKTEKTGDIDALARQLAGAIMGTEGEK